GDGTALTPSSFRVHQISAFGCADVPVAESPDAIFFVQHGGKAIIRMTREGSQDITFLARHFFDKYTIVSIAFARKPEPVLWAVRSDGAVLSFTHNPTMQVEAWALHTLAGEAYSVAVRSEGDEDGVYFVVNYGGTYQVERFAKRIFTDIRDAVFLDRSVTYDGLEDVDPLNIAEADGVYTLALNATGLEDRQIRVDTDNGELRFRVGPNIGGFNYIGELLNGPYPDEYVGTITMFDE